MSFRIIFLLIFITINPIWCQRSPILDPFVGIELVPSTTPACTNQKFHLVELNQGATGVIDSFDDVIVKPHTPRYHTGFVPFKRYEDVVKEKTRTTTTETETSSTTLTTETVYLPQDKEIVKDDKIKEVCSCPLNIKKPIQSIMDHDFTHPPSTNAPVTTNVDVLSSDVKDDSKEVHYDDIYDKIIQLPRLPRPKLGSLFDFSFLKDIGSQLMGGKGGEDGEEEEKVKTSSSTEGNSEDEYDEQVDTKEVTENINNTTVAEHSNLQKYIIDGVSALKAQFPAAVMVTRKYRSRGSDNYRCYCSATCK